jgi:Protein of unknown function (DUF1822)
MGMSCMTALTFTVRLSQDAHRLAERLSQQQWTDRRARQVYLNTLSTYAVNFYLQCMGFETIEKQTDAREKQLERKFLEVAEVEVKGVGKLECRPVRIGDRVMQVPPEAKGDRAGYLAVQLNETLTEAILLGFVKRATTEEIPLEQLRSLDTFLQYASQLENSVKLSQWFQHAFDASWAAIETVFSPPQMAFRGRINGIPNAKRDEIERVKLLNVPGMKEPVALLVWLRPRTEEEIGIGVEVYPTGDRIHLPSELQLRLRDEDGAIVMQAEARTTKNIQFKFSGEPGEMFSVQVTLRDENLIELFQI